MSDATYESVDQTLLLLSEARERAEAASRIAAMSGLDHVRDALEDTDRELLALHRRLLERTYLGATTTTQLRLQSLQS